MNENRVLKNCISANKKNHISSMKPIIDHMIDKGVLL